MKKYLLGAAISVLMTSSAFAEKIGVSMALFDDNFLTVLRNGMVEQAKGMDGVELQVEDAQEDVAKQLDQIKNFVASGVDAIIVNPVDTSATQAMSDAAAAADVPLVYVNRDRSTSTRCRTTKPSSPRTSRAPARSRPRKSAACSRRLARPRRTSM